MFFRHARHPANLRYLCSLQEKVAAVALVYLCQLALSNSMFLVPTESPLDGMYPARLFMDLCQDDACLLALEHADSTCCFELRLQEVRLL